jgi:phage terminase small subunit
MSRAKGGRKPTSIKFTDKQRIFIDEYFICGLNATEAARRAGYAFPNVEGPKNLVNPSIRNEIETRLNERTMSANEVLFRLSEHGRGTMDDFIDPDSLSVDIKRAKNAGKMHLVKEIEYVIRTSEDVQTETIKFKLYDAQSALKTLAQYHGLLIERVKHEDWRSEAIQLIRDGIVTFEALAEELNDDLATELFK